jgi:spore coat protein A
LDPQVWGYGGNAEDAVTGASLGYIQSTTGPTFEPIRDLPTKVKWVHNPVDASGNPLPNLLAVDPSINWANPNGMTMPTEPITAPAYPPGYPDAQSPVPIVTHLHGGEDPHRDFGLPKFPLHDRSGFVQKVNYSQNPGNLLNDNQKFYGAK